MPLKGFLFHIQRFSVHDGPGIRTTLFFKGCNLHCYWCHNPESISSVNFLQFFAESCIGCGRCFTVCAAAAHRLDSRGRHSIVRTACTACGACTEVCPAEALVMAGKEYTVQELSAVFMRDLDFYQKSGGGVTFSGGEALLQKDMVLRCLKLCRAQGLHTAIDTAGHLSWHVFEEVFPYTNLFLFDIKADTDSLHRKGTGTGNRLILSNLRRLLRQGAQVWIRIPVIPGYNDSPAVMEGIAQILDDMSKPARVELMPFHKLGSAKYKSLGLPYQAENLLPPDEETMESFRRIFRQKGYEVN